VASISVLNANRRNADFLQTRSGKKNRSEGKTTRKGPQTCELLDGTDEDREYTEIMGAERQQAVPGAEPRTAL
jgi:hypothetical protein